MINKDSITRLSMRAGARARPCPAGALSSCEDICGSRPRCYTRGESNVRQERIVSSHRTIIHLDLDAFFCAVEEQRDPSLVGRAFAVGGRPETRGVIATCSYAARRCGVHSAMPSSQATRLCPRLTILPPRFDAYRTASHAVMAQLHALTPLVEQISIDEAFLDA